MDNETIKEIFNGDLVVNNLIRDLSAFFPDSNFVANETVIIFDELQECANARSSIKPFMLDGRFDIIATGSLLGLRGYNKKKSKGIPTGFEYIIDMYPMDFEEYLLAKGLNEDLLSYIKDCFFRKEKVSDAVNKTFMNYYKEYLCVGGMPDAVNTFLTTNDMNKVRRVQKSILEQYKDDFGKHLDDCENEYVNKIELTKIMDVFNSIPNQLAKENKKFQYSVIKKNARGREYTDAITWLEEFGLIKCCYKLNKLELPLEGYKDNFDFKIYFGDTGLFISMLEQGTVTNILNGDLKIYRGAIFENIIADSYVKNDKALYYYNETKGLKIDFVTRHENDLALIEVKSTNGNAKSLKEVLNNKEKYNVNKAIKLIDGNVNYSGNILTIPLYMAMFL